MDETFLEIENLERQLSGIQGRIRYVEKRTKPIGANQSRNTKEAIALALKINAILVDFHADIGGWGAFIANSEGIKHIRLIQLDPPWQIWISNLFLPGTEKIGRTLLWMDPSRPILKVYQAYRELFSAHRLKDYIFSIRTFKFIPIVICLNPSRKLPFR